MKCQTEFDPKQTLGFELDMKTTLRIIYESISWKAKGYLKRLIISEVFTHIQQLSDAYWIATDPNNLWSYKLNTTVLQCVLPFLKHRIIVFIVTFIAKDIVKESDGSLSPHRCVSIVDMLTIHEEIKCLAGFLELATKP